MINKKIIYLFLMLFMFVLMSYNTKNKYVTEIPNYTNFNGFDMSEDNVNFKIDGKSLTLKLPIYLDKNRYFISLNEFTHELHGTIEKVSLS